jgi:hypothetical protein
MLGRYRVYDADAHVILASAIWEDLAEKYAPRRLPPPATFNDTVIWRPIRGAPRNP